MSSNGVRIRAVGRPRKAENIEPVAELLLRITISEVAQHGAFAVSARKVCEIAGVSFGSVNHNFGSWNGLLAAASVQAYGEYIDQLWPAADSFKQSPEARLEAWIRAQIAYGQSMSGWSAVINYPSSFEPITSIVRQLYSQQMTELLELNLARLGRLTMDIRDQVVSPFDFDIGEFPKKDMLADLRAVARATTIGWATLGMAVWAASAHERGKGSPEMAARFEEILNFNISKLIEGIAQDRL